MKADELPPAEQLKGMLVVLAWLALAIFLRDQYLVDGRVPPGSAAAAHAPAEPASCPAPGAR